MKTDKIVISNVLILTLSLAISQPQTKPKQMTPDILINVGDKYAVSIDIPQLLSEEKKSILKKLIDGRQTTTLLCEYTCF